FRTRDGTLWFAVNNPPTLVQGRRVGPTSRLFRRDGTTWTSVPTRLTSESSLTVSSLVGWLPVLDSVSFHGTGRDGVWVLGPNGMATPRHWDGTQWTPTDEGVPFGEAHQLAGSDGDNVWLVSDDAVLQRTDSRWHDVTAAAGGGASAVWVGSDRDVWL